jgi:hypothetical protein
MALMEFLEPFQYGPFGVEDALVGLGAAAATIYSRTRESLYAQRILDQAVHTGILAGSAVIALSHFGEENLGIFTQAPAEFFASLASGYLGYVTARFGPRVWDGMRNAEIIDEEPQTD